MTGSRSQPLVAAIWEGTQCEADEAQQLAEFCAGLIQRPPLCCSIFPVTTTAPGQFRQGPMGVVAKPFQLDDLVWQLRKAMTEELQLD